MDPKTASLDQLKAQIAQIDALAAEGVLTSASARQQRDELERQVLAAVMQGPASATVSEAEPVVRVPRKFSLGIAAFVLLVGAVGYSVKGNHAALQVGPGEGVSAASQTPADPSSPVMQQAQIEAMVKDLEERVKTTPQDTESMQMLARSYGVLGRYADAVKLHQQLLVLKPKDAQVLADYADALAMANGSTLEGEPTKLILQAVKLDPNNVKALALAGTVAFNANDFAGAVAYWERAVKAAPPESGYAQQLQGAMVEARQRAGQPPGAAAAAAGTVAGGAAVGAVGVGETGTAMSSAAAAKVSGRVSLPATLKDRFGPDDTVFIFARAPGGSRMPLAILKRKVSDLPLEFTLDDSLAMSPAAKLSSTPQVVVGARISKTGNAMPGPGDYQTLSAPVAVGSTGLVLEINEAVK